MVDSASRNPSALERFANHPAVRFAAVIASLLSGLAVVLGVAFSSPVRQCIASIYRHNAWIYMAILVIAIGLLAWRNRQLAKRASPHSGLPVVVDRPGSLVAPGSVEAGATAVEVIAATVPGGRSLASYLRSTLFAEDRLALLRGMEGDHHLRRYEKSFRLHGTDIWTHERYDLQNRSPKPTTSLPIITLGGSALRAEQLEAEAFQVRDGTRQKLRLDLKDDDERFKRYTAHFAGALPPGDVMQLDYDEFWPGAMTASIDAVFYTQVLYYSRSITELCSDLTFDAPVDSITAWWYDLESEVCEPDGHAPREVSHTTTEWIYNWTIPNPATSRLYFVLFDRSSTLNADAPHVTST